MNCKKWAIVMLLAAATMAVMLAVFFFWIGSALEINGNVIVSAASNNVTVYNRSNYTWKTAVFIINETNYDEGYRYSSGHVDASSQENFTLSRFTREDGTPFDYKNTRVVSFKVIADTIFGKKTLRLMSLTYY